jgi:hypothetical protein
MKARIVRKANSFVIVVPKILLDEGLLELGVDYDIYFSQSLK